MNIAFLAPRYHSNQVRLVEYLISQDHKVEFFVIRIGQSEDHSKLKPTLVELSSIFKFFRKFFKNQNTLFDYIYGFPSLSFLNEYRKKNFQVIIIRIPYSFLSLTFALYSKITGTKIIFYTQRAIHQEKNAIKDFIVNFFIKLFNAKWISPCLGDIKFPKSIKKMYYIPFCIDEFEYDKKWFVNETVQILSIGKFVQRKNHHLLIKALTPFASRFNFQLTIIGELSETTGFEYYNYILELIENTPYKIIVKKNLNRNEIYEEYKKSDIFVLPSKNEPASVSNLEAMAFGLPVITSDTNMTSTYTLDNGFVFKTDSIDDLQHKLEKLLQDKSLIKSMGEKSRDLVKKNHNSEIVYKYLIEDVVNL